MTPAAIAAGTKEAVIAHVGLPALFVSDLHLTPERPAIHQAFRAFLQTEAMQARALYVLGDLFDYWIGDDDMEEPFHATIVAELAAVSRSGCSVHLMHGNRDFLLGKRFAAASRAELMPDPTVIVLAGTRTLLLHGDTLCIDDPDYQAFRTKVRSEAWQAEFSARPLAERRAIALQLRADSHSSQQLKADEIMDVAARAVADAFRRHDCQRMIHGHTHRPARHEHLVDGRICERWVLGDWYTTGSFLRWDAHGRCQSVALTGLRPPPQRSNEV